MVPGFPSVGWGPFREGASNRILPPAPDRIECRLRNGLWRSLVSALVWGTKGRRFESCQPDQSRRWNTANGPNPRVRPVRVGTRGPSVTASRYRLVVRHGVAAGRFRSER